MIDEISDLFIDHGADPSGRSSIELESFFLFVFGCTYLYFFAGDGAVDFEGGGLFDLVG